MMNTENNNDDAELVQYRKKARFYALRESCGLTQKSVAVQFGVDEVQARRWESTSMRYDMPDNILHWIELKYQRMRSVVDASADKMFEGIDAGLLVNL